MYALMKKIIILLSIAVILLHPSCSKLDGNETQLNNGKSGSITTFAVVGAYLYSLNKPNLEVYSLADKAHPQKVNSIVVGNNIETVFSYLNKLYIGASDGIYIVDISNPVQPIVQSNATHFYGCDPVVAKGNYAYSTVRSGRTCNNNTAFSSLLIVYDVSNSYYPQEVAQINMQSPAGLGYDGNYLFVCDGTNGIIVFDITIPDQPLKINQIHNVNAYDLITNNGVLIVSAGDSYQFYSYTDINHIVKLSQVNKN
jgi:hypothetical protein